MTREEAIEIINRNCTEGSQLREACAMFISELSKSNDESVRKSIIHLLQVGGYMSFEDREKAFAYLEKMKEASKAIEAVDRIDKYIDENVANAHDMKDSNPDKKYYRGWDDALGEMARILQDVYSGEKQKEQKPIEPSDDELQRHQDELYNFKVFAAKQAKEYHISYVHDFEWNNFCAEILSYFNEQNPAEWSEEDKKALNSVLSSGKTVLTESNREWLKLLPERFNLQPKQEWSEEDEHCIELLDTIIDSSALIPKNRIKCHSFLKSLRPSWKPSEEHFQGLRRAITKAEKDSDAWNSLTDLYEQLKKL